MRVEGVVLIPILGVPKWVNGIIEKSLDGGGASLFDAKGFVLTEDASDCLIYHE